MPTTFASLCANEIASKVEALLDVLGVANHVHVEDTSRVQSVDNMLWWDTDCRDEEFGARVDDDAYEFVELALRIVVAVHPVSNVSHPN